MKSILTATVLLTSFGVFSGTARAGHNLDKLTHRLQIQANNALREIRHNAWGTPHSRHLYEDVYEVYKQATHINRIIHRGESLEHVLSDLADLDEHLHHAEELAEKIRRLDRRHSGHGSHFHHGSRNGFGIHIGSRHGSHNGFHLKRLEDQLEDMLDTVHEMRDELEDLFPSRRSRRIIAPPVPPVPPVPNDRITFPIGRGGFSFSLVIRK